jgi:hypothetical protein
MDNGITAPGRLLRTVPSADLKRFPDQRRPIVLVLGMHRSGTSLCSHVLSALGVDMTDDMTAPRSGLLGVDNPKGHWERWEIVEFHDRILDAFNRLYGSIKHDFCLPVAWWADPRITSIRREIAAYLEARMESAPFGFKDPRTVRLMPLWHQIFSNLKLAPKIVYCLRDPVQVARSVHARDGFSPELAEYRWLTYNMDFFRYAGRYEFCTVEYESWFEDPAKNLMKLRTFLDLPSCHDDSDLEFAVPRIVDQGLRHDDPSIAKPYHPMVRSVYELACRAEQDPAALDRLQKIATDFLSFQQLQYAFEREFEHNATMAARLPEIEQEAKMLREALNERDSRLTSLEAHGTALGGVLVQAEQDVAETRHALETARLELTARDKRLTELEAELAERAVRHSPSPVRDDLPVVRREAEARVSAADAMPSNVAEIPKTLIGVEASSELSEKKAASLQRQIAELQDALGGAERGARLAKAKAAETERAIEIEKRRAELAEYRALQAERTAGEVASSAVGLQNRIGTLETDLQNRIGTLETELAEARRVGRAAVQALAAGTATDYREPRLGWRHTIRQLLGNLRRATVNL